MSYQPNRVILDAEAAHYPFAQKILQRLPNALVETMPAAQSAEILNQLPPVTEGGKKILHLKKFQGNPLKLCPGFTDSLLCCNYQVIDLIENCPLECSYCILQAFLSKPIISLHVNVEEMVAGIKATIATEPNRFFRVGTGEHSDSLAMDHLFQVNPYLIEEFAKIPNASLELKSKTGYVDNLIGLNHGGKAVIAFSLNPSEIVKSEELKTANLRQRFEAAEKVKNDGYKLAFHFDPLIYYPDWEIGYKKVIDEIFDRFAPKEIAWISMGTLRYIPKLKDIAMERFKNPKIFSGEFISGDGKMKYLKVLRKELISTISGWITEKSKGDTPLYICMEKQSLWKSCMPQQFENHEALEKYLSKNLISE